MDLSKKVLLVTNSASEEEVSLVQDAVIQAEKQGLYIKLNLVHVIPNLPTCYFNIPSMVLLAEQYYDEAKRSLSTIGDKLNVAKKDQWLITGKVKTEVLRLAGKLGTHFILASSTSIQDLHKALSLTKAYQPTPIKNINHIVTSNL